MKSHFLVNQGSTIVHPPFAYYDESATVYITGVECEELHLGICDVSDCRQYLETSHCQTHTYILVGFYPVGCVWGGGGGFEGSTPN